MSFTNAQKVDIRRFCGYPAYGGTPSGFQSWRFFQEYGLMEYRLNNMAAEEETVIETIYLANLYTLELAIVGATANLDTAQAAVWTHNKNEVRDRTALFTSWRTKLAEFIGVPTGPALKGAGTVRMVV